MSNVVLTASKADLDLTTGLSAKGMSALEVADAIEKAHSIQSSASEIDGSVNKKISFVFGNNMYNSTSEKYFLDTTQYVPAIAGGNSPIFDNSSTFKRYGGKTMRIGESAAGDSTMFGKKTNLENPLEIGRAHV